MTGAIVTRSADGATIVVALVILTLLAGQLLPQRTPDLTGAPIGIDTDGAALVLVLRSDCPYCQESMPFYRRLLEGGDTDNVQVVVAAPPDDAGISEYLTSEGVEPDSVVFVEGDDLPPVPGTPTLLLVDREGVVTHAWIGLLDSDREAEVIDALSG